MSQVFGINSLGRVSTHSRVAGDQPPPLLIANPATATLVDASAAISSKHDRACREREVAMADQGADRTLAHTVGDSQKSGGAILDAKHPPYALLAHPSPRQRFLFQSEVRAKKAMFHPLETLSAFARVTAGPASHAKHDTSSAQVADTNNQAERRKLLHPLQAPPSPFRGARADEAADPAICSVVDEQ